MFTFEESVSCESIVCSMRYDVCISGISRIRARGVQEAES